MRTLTGYSFATAGEFVGREFAISDWTTADQETIDKFAGCTGDDQWIHVDVEKAKRESIYGATVAHGFLVLSLLAKLQFDAGVVPPDAAQAINVGLNRVRFVAPVKSGARVRNRLKLLSAKKQGEGRVMLTTQNTMEIEGEEKPAMVAELLVLLIAPTGET